MSWIFLAVKFGQIDIRTTSIYMTFCIGYEIYRYVTDPSHIIFFPLLRKKNDSKGPKITF